MYIRALHHQLSDMSPAYRTGMEPILWMGREVTSRLPDWMVAMADRIAFAFEIVIPKMSFIIGAAAMAYYSGSPEAALAALGALMWFAYDIADAFQFYPYDYLEDMAGDGFKIERESLVVRKGLIDRIAFYLTKPEANNNNVLAIGPAGSGKTATALALVQHIESEECPPELKGKKVYRVRLDKMMANVHRPGDFEMRFITLLSVAKFNKGAILFIDEAHQLLDRRGSGGTSLANLLKPFLTGGMRCFAATTNKEYERYVIEDEGFEQRFNLIEIPTISESTCLRILRKKFSGLTSEAAQIAMEQAQNLHPSKALPRSAILLLENTQHRTKAVPTEDSILDQVDFERTSLGSIAHSVA